MQTTKQFKVVAKSLNTNSFGLHQLILVSKDGEAYKSHASIYHAQIEGDTINQVLVVDDQGEIKQRYFRGHELTQKLDNVPSDVLAKIFN